MTIVNRRPDLGSNPGAPVRSARPAWIALALVPVGIALSIIWGFAGETSTGAGGGDIGGALPSLVALAAPTAAVILAAGPARSKSRSGVIALTVAGLLLIATFAWLAIGVISMGAGWFTALAVVVTVLAVFAWLSRHAPG